MESATEIIADVKELICREYCKYKEQCLADEDKDDWDAISDRCILDRL